MTIILSLFLAPVMSFVPAFFYTAIVYAANRFKKEPIWLLAAVFAWGAIVATMAALVSQIILSAIVGYVIGSRAVISFMEASVFAPVTEEILKAMAVLIVLLVFRNRFDSVLDGIVLAAITALGFAATENTLYLFSAGASDGIGSLFILWFLRVVMTGWNHAIFTAFTGIGIATARLNTNPAIRILAPLIGLTLAIASHSFYNSLAGLFSGVGFLISLPIMGFEWLLIVGVIIWSTLRERRQLAVYLADEVGIGVISEAQYLSALSPWSRTIANIRAIGAGRVGDTARLYQLCAELAHKKHQLVQLGEEANGPRVRALRERLADVAHKTPMHQTDALRPTILPTQEMQLPTAA